MRRDYVSQEASCLEAPVVPHTLAFALVITSAFAFSLARFHSLSLSLSFSLARFHSLDYLSHY